MNFCPKCGTAIEAGVRFCPKCGFNLQDSETSTNLVHDQVQNASQVAAAATQTVQPQQSMGNSFINYQSNLGLIGALKQYFQNYANFDGRMSRANYWWSVLGVELITGVAWILSYLLGSSVLLYIVSLALFLPGLTSPVRRLHDSDRSLWSFFWILIPIVGYIYLIVLLCKAGDREANRFG